MLRFHPACPWRDDNDKRSCAGAAGEPSARSTTTSSPAVQRVRLDDDGRKLERRMLGVVEGAAVKLAPPDNGELAVGEGVETCLAAMQLGFRPAWSLGSCGNIGRPAADRGRRSPHTARRERRSAARVRSGLREALAAGWSQGACGHAGGWLQRSERRTDGGGAMKVNDFPPPQGHHRGRPSSTCRAGMTNRSQSRSGWCTTASRRGNASCSPVRAPRARARSTCICLPPIRSGATGLAVCRRSDRRSTSTLKTKKTSCTTGSPPSSSITACASTI